LATDFNTNYNSLTELYTLNITVTTVHIKDISWFCRVRVRVRVRVTLRLAVYRQSVRLGAEPLETHGQNLFSQLNSCGYSYYITCSLMRGWVCHLQLLLALAVGLVTIFYCHRFETSPCVASYDSQGYGGGIRLRLHTGIGFALRTRPAYNISARTAQKTALPTVLLLLRHVAIVRIAKRTLLPSYSIVACYESVAAIAYQQQLFTEPLPSTCCCIAVYLTD
jgi:hypothetical protein